MKKETVAKSRHNGYLLRFVIPRSGASTNGKLISDELTIGKVIGLSRFDLNEIGPMLLVRDLITKKTIHVLPMQVHKLAIID